MVDTLMDDALLFCIMLTLRVAFIATVISALLGLGMAWFMTARNIPGKRWVDAICALPLVLPPTVIGYCLILLLGRRGPLGAWLSEFGISVIFTWQGAVIAATTVVFPLTYRASKAALESVDHTLEDAARTLGSTEWEVFTRVSLPLAWRGILAGISLAFARGMGEFGATLMIAGNLPGKTQTLALAVYDSFQSGNDERALTLVVLTSVICASLLVMAETLTSKRLTAGRA